MKAYAMMFTCKSIYREAFPLYYSQNTFKLSSSHDLKTFIDHLGPQPRSQVTKISIGWGGPALAKAARMLQSFIGLRDLEIQIWTFYTFNNSTDDNVEVKIYGMKDLLRIRGLEKLEVQCCTYVVYRDGRVTSCTREQQNTFLRKLEVLKQPREIAFVDATR